jgi:menaquinone-9 beta-reductase
MAPHRTGLGADDTTWTDARALASRYDAVIVGARCAGAATAMLLARRGLRVLAVDRGRYGSDTLSTHALMRGGVLQLHKWGLLPALAQAGVPAIRHTTFFYGDEAVPIPIKPRDGVDALYAPRRSLLDRVLVDAAVDSGTDVVHGTELIQVLRNRAGRPSGVLLDMDEGGLRRIATDIVIGADGLRSTVARIVGAQPYRTASHASGVVYGHWLGLRHEGYEWYFRPGISAGVIPTNGNATCVFVAAPASAFAATFRGNVAAGYHRLVAEISPELADNVARAQRVANLHGFAGQPGFFRQSWGPGWALAGDAGCFRDPLTAHGMTDALRDAELLADAVSVGSDDALAEYQARRDALARDLFDITDEIASFQWDLDTVRPMHEALAEAMSREAKALAGGLSAASAGHAPLPPSSGRRRPATGGPPRAGHRG